MNKTLKKIANKLTSAALLEIFAVKDPNLATWRKYLIEELIGVAICKSLMVFLFAATAFIFFAAVVAL